MHEKIYPELTNAIAFNENSHFSQFLYSTMKSGQFIAFIFGGPLSGKMFARHLTQW
jgi:hypothetical protein